MDALAPLHSERRRPQRGARRRMFLPLGGRPGVARPVSISPTVHPDPADPAHLAGLIQSIAARQDRNAFAALFGHFAPRVKAYLIRLGTSPTMAEELAQETMLSVWRKAGLFDVARAGASTWIFTIARNLRIDAARSDRRRDPLADEHATVPPPTPQPDMLVAAGQRDKRVRAAMEALPADQAEVVHHAFFLDKPHSEISQALGIPLGTVKSRLRLAMNRLRDVLEFDS